ncbi:hypothetical protein AWE51_08205 [Aquimarina aggregata]|uniref:HTH araC/xylS-type domain-containing protein n=1 Tax=Aquimarina aggregata TaxID=1642818 RepID=A0A162Z8E9_9FLAO|nr:AraC family transcriptional regulator [Aquimarina aggregata]KZS39623.1 hypothetical protein AWE51_08205 [Aquimarina aggregata]
MLLRIKPTYRLLTTIVLVFTILNCYTSFGQNLINSFTIPDSLQQSSFDDLYNDFSSTWSDTLTSKIYLHTYLKKAQLENSQIKMAQAYCLLSHYCEKESEKLRFLDLSIVLSKGLGDKKYPMQAYSFKAGHYLKKGRYTLALDDYLKALAISEKFEDTEYTYITKYNIARVKTAIEKHKEALPLFKENFDHNSSKSPINDRRYIRSSIALAESYRYNFKLDSATTINYKATQEVAKSEYNFNRFQGRISINEGINLFFKKKYNVAQDSIENGLKLLNTQTAENKKTLILASFYLGKLQLLKDNKAAAQNYFKKTDSILQHEIITPFEVREGYEHMITFYKESNQKETQLEYIGKLLRFDSIFNREASSVATTLFKEFDTPALLKEKERLINELKGNNKNLNLTVFILLFITTVIGAFLFWQYQKRKSYQEKFEHLIDQKNTPKINKQKSKDDIGVPKEVVEEILLKLSSFEEKKHFLKKNISTTSLAKDIKTNTKYLSKVVNHFKQKNFANYINDLRINYAVHQLKTNPTLKNYTIQGIAEEMGFNTAESFSSAFKKTTGIKTSYFIKKLSAIDTL